MDGSEGKTLPILGSTTIHRDTGLRETEQHFPEALAWAVTFYGSQSELMLGDTVIPSFAGFQQGDPLAGLAFSLTLQPILEMIQVEVPTLEFNAWYLDDSNFVGNKEEIQMVVDIIEREGPAQELHLSTTATVLAPAQLKSTVWCPGDLTSQAHVLHPVHCRWWLSGRKLTLKI